MLHCLLPTTWVPPLQSPLQHTTECESQDAVRVARAVHERLLRLRVHTW